MSNLRLFAALATLLGCITAGVLPTQTQQPATTASETYPETPEGLQQQMEDLFAAFRSGQERQITARLQALILPDPKAWFTRVFGAQEGARIAAQYERQDTPLELSRRRNYEYLAQTEGVKLQAERLQAAASDRTSDRLVNAILAAMTERAALYSLRVRKPDSSDATPLGYFFHVDGRFRLVEELVFSALSTAPPPRIRMGGKVHQAALEHKVAPTYPPEARNQGIQGVVSLQVVVGRDGSIKEVQVIRGDPTLAAAAADAVRQWRYRPTLLNGQPVEVVTTVEVTFTLGR